MYKQDFLKRLKNLISLYEKQLYRNKDAYRCYISLLQLDMTYSYMTGHHMFDEELFEIEHPLIYNKVFERSLSNNIKKTENILSLTEFCKDNFLDIKSFLDDNLNPIKADEVDYLPDLSKSDFKPLINEFLKYEKVEDKEIFNKFCRSRRIIKGNLKDENYSGLIFFDLFKNNDYIFLASDIFDNYYTSCTIAHELGHALDVIGLNRDVKEKYVMTSPFLEVMSYNMENKFYDFLIDENIIKSEAQFFKSNLMNLLFYNLSNCITLFENSEDLPEIDFDPLNAIIYGYGQILGISLSNSDDDVINKFMNLHHTVYDDRLLKEIGFNKDKAIKVLSKELNKMYK